ncbi:hypothetical protein O4H49_01780 [Kiloniella laminariae]|uniref:DUF7683 domain-containing protein n=1 Tax=Kiloniella laminariae TaxID=454162 RepID=A0ABT4LEH5_9PROT|nr:hypothetical protein [Kiloniella laminariae]
MPKVTLRQYIIYFRNEDEKLLGETDLPYMDISVYQKLFKIDSDNPMYDSYPIGQLEAHFFKDQFDYEFDLEKCCYFFEQSLP